MRFVLAAGIWCTPAVNNRQSHNHHPREGGKWKKEKKFLLKSIIRRAHCVQKPLSNKRCKCNRRYGIKIWQGGQWFVQEALWITGQGSQNEVSETWLGCWNLSISRITPLWDRATSNNYAGLSFWMQWWLEEEISKSLPVMTSYFNKIVLLRKENSDEIIKIISSLTTVKSLSLFILWHLSVHLSLLRHPKEPRHRFVWFSSTFIKLDESWNQLQQNKFYISILRKQVSINEIL